MSTLAIVQARMSSTRFPGKVLEDLQGAPMIIRQLERIQRATSLDQVVVATTTDPSDDPLVEILEQAHIQYVRGDLDDVLGRFIKVIDEFNPEVVIRLTADCPLASPQVIDEVVTAFLNSDVDYLSNTMKPTYPDGIDVEVVRPEALRFVDATTQDQPEREHVTLGVYRRPEIFQIRNIVNDIDLSSLRWTVDTPEDFSFVKAVYAELFPANPEFEMSDVLDYLDRHPERSRTDQDAVRNAALQGLNTGVMNA